MDIKDLWEDYYNAFKQQDWTNALAALNSINKKKPRDSQVYLKMGDLMQRMGRSESAIEAYHKAAVYLVKEGFMQKAAAIFKIILRLDPNNREAAVKLERVFEMAASAKTAFAPFPVLPDETQPVTSEALAYSKPEEQVEGVPKPAQLPQAVEPSKQEEPSYGEIAFPGEIPEKEKPGSHSFEPSKQEEPSYGEIAFPCEMPEVEKPGPPLFDGTPFPDVGPEASGERELGPGYGEISLDDEEMEASVEKTLDSLFKPQAKKEKYEKQEEKGPEDFEDFDDLLAEAAREVPIPEERFKTRTDLPAFLMPLGENQAREFIRKAAARTFRAGDRIIREGDKGDSLFFIKKGSSKVVANILGKEFVLATLGIGDVFGEVTFLTGRPRTASIVAEADNEVLEFDRQLLEGAIAANPEVLESLNDLYNTRVMSTMKKIVGD